MEMVFGKVDVDERSSIVPRHECQTKVRHYGFICGRTKTQRAAAFRRGPLI
jgi:hypothetical protein